PLRLHDVPDQQPERHAPPGRLEERLSRGQALHIAYPQATRGVDLQLLHLLLEERTRDVDGIIPVERIERLHPNSSANHSGTLPFHALAALGTDLRQAALFDTVRAEEFRVHPRKRLPLDRLNGEMQLRGL